MAKISLTTLQDSIQGIAELVIDDNAENLKDDIDEEAENTKENFSKHVFDVLAKYQGVPLDEKKFTAFVDDMTNFDDIYWPGGYTAVIQYLEKEIVSLLNEYQSLEIVDDEDNAE